MWDKVGTTFPETMNPELSASDGDLRGTQVPEKEEEMEVSYSRNREESMIQVKSEDLERLVSKGPRNIKTRVKNRKEVEPTSRCLRSSMTKVTDKEEKSLAQLKNQELDKMPLEHLKGSTVHLKIKCVKQPLSTNLPDPLLHVKQEETDQPIGTEVGTGPNCEGLVIGKPEIISKLDLWERTSMWDEVGTTFTETMGRELSASDGDLRGTQVPEKEEEMEVSYSRNREESMIQVKSEDLERLVSKGPRNIKTRVKNRKEVEPTSRCLRSSMTKVTDKEEQSLAQLKNQELDKMPLEHLKGSTVHLKIECVKQPLSINLPDPLLHVKQEETDQPIGTEVGTGPNCEGSRLVGKRNKRRCARFAKHVEPYTRSREANQQTQKLESDMEKEKPLLRRQRKLSENILHVKTPCMKGVCRTATLTDAHLSMNSNANGRILSTKDVPSGLQSETDCICSEYDKSFNGHAQLLAHQEIHNTKTSVLYTHEGMHIKRQLCPSGEIEEHSSFVTPESTQSVAGQYTCTECDKQFIQSSDLASHQQIHMVERPYGFNELGEGASSTGELTVPYQNSTEVKTYVCDTCGKRFWQKSNFIKHLRQHRMKRLYECNDGRKKFCYSSGLQVNHKIDNMDNIYICAVCLKCFNRAHLLSAHQATHSEEENLNLVKPTPEVTLYLCAECGESFNDWEFMIAHSATHELQKEDCGNETDSEINEMEMAHTCTECGMSFNDTSGLSSHQQQHHRQGKEFMCNYCGKYFNNILLLMVHEQKHPENRPYVCTECGKCLSTASSLRVHRQVHIMEKWYTCTDCGQGFRNAQLLSAHRLTHAGENPYLCGVCGECFPDPASFIRHHKSHTSRTPYSCSECGKRYTKKPSLDAHLLSHAKEEKQSHLNTTVNGAPYIDSAYYNFHVKEEDQSNLKTPTVCEEISIDCSEQHTDIKEQNQVKVSGLIVKEEPYIDSADQHMHVKEENQSNLNTSVFNQGPGIDFVDQHICTKVENQKSLKALIIKDEPYMDFTNCDINLKTENQTNMNVSFIKEEPDEPGSHITEEKQTNFNRLISKEELDSSFNQTVQGKEENQKALCTLILNEEPYMDFEPKDNVINWESLTVLQQTCVTQETFPCSECIAVFSCSSDLSMHQTEHIREPEYVCVECGQCLSSPDQLSRHRQIHEREKLHKCKECGMSFSRQSHLSRHLLTHEVMRLHTCMECGQAFRSAGCLYKHKRKHLRDNILEKIYACPTCDQGFRNSRLLETHKLTHAGENPYLCSDCGESFKDPASFLTHHKTHSQVKEYVCPECGGKFPTKLLFRLHELAHSTVS